MSKQKFYHASPRKFHKGDILTGRRPGGNGGDVEGSHTNVCMTTSPMPHGTIANLIPGWFGYYDNRDNKRPECKQSEWYVYRVEPYECDAEYEPGNAEYQCKRAIVIDCLGPATKWLKDVKNLDKPVRDSYALSPRVERDKAEKRANRIFRRRRNVDESVLRSFIKESLKSLNESAVMSVPEDLCVTVNDDGKSLMLILWNPENASNSLRKRKGNEFHVYDGVIAGTICLRRISQPAWNKSGGLKVELVSAEEGSKLGPLLYNLALNKFGPFIPDRSVMPKAADIWRGFRDKKVQMQSSNH